jgi:hypothetical protein
MAACMFRAFHEYVQLSPFTLLTILDPNSSYPFFLIRNYSGGFDGWKKLPGNEDDIQNCIRVSCDFFLKAVKIPEVTNLINQQQSDHMFLDSTKPIKVISSLGNYFLLFRLFTANDDGVLAMDLEDAVEGYIGEFSLRIERYDKFDSDDFMLDDFVVLTRDEMKKLLLFLPD